MNYSFRMQKGQKILFFIFFIFLTLNFYNNPFKVLPDEQFKDLDIFCESLLYGRLAKSQKDGVFSEAGLLGVIYDENSLPENLKGHVPDSLKEMRIYRIREFAINTSMHQQLDYYLTKTEDIPDGYALYLSQIGGQGFVLSFFDKILPFDNNIKFKFFKLINAALCALCLILFMLWAYRNWGIISIVIYFVLILFSPWLVFFGNSLFWVLWAFYIPFLTMLFLLYKKHMNPKSISNRQIWIFLYLSVLIKCFFNGFEFFTTSFACIFCPILYYFLLERKSIKEFIIFSLKTGMIIFSALITQTLILVMQLTYVKGNLISALNYLSYTFIRRASFSYYENDDYGVIGSIKFIFAKYLQGNAFGLKLFNLENFNIFFIALFSIIVLSGIIIYLHTIFKKRDQYLKNKALLITTAFSFICPASWFIIFREHSYFHRHLDFIVWYIPFLLYGFLVIGVGCSCIISILKKNISHNKT